MLSSLDILVISNALHASNANNWLPPNPSAFTPEEIAAVESWVRGGGSLLLIADHQPFPGAAAKLARQFGIEFINAYAMDGPPDRQVGSLVYSRADGSLADHAVTRGVDAIANFGGSAFQISAEHQPLLTMSARAVAKTRDFAAQSRAYSGERPIPGWLQGALLRHGEGRVAVFGEAAMFSAQVFGPNKIPMGMNAPVAKDNPRFMLNVIAWLAER